MTDAALWHAAWQERDRLLRIARRHSRNRADAEEVVSEATLRCATHPNLDPGRLAAMLTAVTLRLCVDRLRARVVADRVAPRLLDPPSDDIGDVLDRAEAMWLAAEMARLTDPERAVLTARMLGLTLTETADALGVTYRAAEGLLGRARRKMRDVWARTLALLWPRRRGSWPLLAVAGVAVVVAARCGPWTNQQQAPAVRRVQVVRADGTAGSLHKAPLAVPSARLHRVLDGARTVSPRRPALTTPDVRVGPVHAHPSTITTDETDPVGRVERCVHNGFKIMVDTSGSTRVVCK